MKKCYIRDTNAVAAILSAAGSRVKLGLDTVRMAEESDSRTFPVTGAE